MPRPHLASPPAQPSTRQPRGRARGLAAAGAVLVAAAGAPAAVTPIAAQTVSAQCPPGASPISPERITQDACQKSVDLFVLLAPQLGTSVAGGNASLGQSGTLGGPGHFGLSLRVTGLRGSVPQFDALRVSTGGAQATRLPTDERFVGFAVADGEIGVFKGIPLGFTNVGGVDALVSAAYIPDIEADEVSVRTAGGSLRLGYGARLGILQETAVVPGVSVTYLRRETPRTSIVARIGDDTVGVRSARVRTDSWRLVAGKRFLVVGLALGVGQDRLDSEASVDAVVNESVAGLVDVRIVAPVARLTQRLTRTNYFANATLLAVPYFRVVAELGRTQGGALRETYNQFGRRPDDAYTYGSLGVRVGF